MLDKSHIARASWTLIDQGIVSAGAFIVNILLARHLAPAEYGAFALLFGALLALQVVNSSVLFYPLSVRLAVADGARGEHLLRCTIVLVMLCSIPLCLVLGVGMELLGRADLVAGAVAWFAAWQMQECMRRGLLAKFRHDTAVIGDAVSYLGQAAIVSGLLAANALTLSNVLFGAAAASALAALIQAAQLRLSLRGPCFLADTLRDFWSIGGWSLANNLLSLVRLQIFPWALAATSGPASAALFQAALNVVNLANPVVIGLCNVIPQTAAHALANGTKQAWKAARTYAILGMPPTFGYYAIALFAPELVLRIFYGAHSPYLDLSLPVRIFVLAWVAGYATDMVCSFLHGIDAARLALMVNSLGVATSVILALPLTSALGLTGCCLALAAANAVRLAASKYALSRMVTDERASFA